MTPSRPSLPRSRRFVPGRHPLRRACLALAAALCPFPLPAQTTSTTTTVDAGAALLAQDNTATVVAPTIGADWRLDAVRSTLRASGSATVANSDRWAVQGVGAGSWFFGTAYAPREVGAVASVLRLFGVPTSLAASLVARQHVSNGDAGAWIGGSAGLTGAGFTLAPTLGVDGALWRRGTNWRATLSVSALTAWLDSARVYLLPPATRFSALDVAGGLEWHDPRFELAGSVGMRRSAWTGGEGPPAGTAFVALGSAVVPLRPVPGLALVLSAGNQFADPIRGAPSVRYVALSLRLRPAALRHAPPKSPPTSVATLDSGDGASAGSGTATLVVSGSGSQRTIHVHAAAARHVELRSDATGWRSVELVRQDDDWETTIALAPGTHRVMLRIDDGEWSPPANLPVVDDDFGGRVGLLVVP
jgi:hypothetical protein